MGNRVAVLDVGSHSTRLLVADIGPEYRMVTLRKELIPTRMAEGLSMARTISWAAIERTSEAMQKLLRVAHEDGVTRVFCFATAAVRDAENRDDVIVRISHETGQLLDVLSDADEAGVGYFGIDGTGARGIIDIGGGSTEIALGSEDMPSAVASMPLGTVRALDKFPLGNELPDQLTMEAMGQWLERVMRDQTPGMAAKAKALSPMRWHGMGGTITTLAAVDQSLATYKSDRVQGYVLTRPKVDALFTRLSVLTVAQRKTVIGLSPERADIILGGLMILRTFMEMFGISVVQASEKDNLDGYLRMKLMNEAAHHRENQEGHHD